MDSYTEIDLENPLLSRLGNPDWVAHVRDHYRLLSRNSTSTVVPDSLFYQYRNRPIYLLGQLNLGYDNLVPVIVINNISLVDGLEERHKTLLIPSEASVRLMVESFDQLVA